jgi:hypothetical protein
MPSLWKAGMALLIACLLASMAIAAYRLATTPTEILGAGFRGLRTEPTRAVNDEAQSRR